MLILRFGGAAIVALGMLGSLAYTTGQGLYVRSDGYRRACVSKLEQALGLPSDIGRVVPHTRVARAFHDVTVWLPQRRGIALRARDALLTLTPTPASTDDYELVLSDGSADVSTDTWLRNDYRLVVESGLRTGFAPGGPRRVDFSKMDLRLQREAFELLLEDAAGHVAFESATRAAATVICSRLNGHTTPQPVLLRAEISPREAGVQFDSLEFTAARIPLTLLGLQRLAGLALTRGEFSGRLFYTEAIATRSLTLAGRCMDLDLRECTRGPFGEGIAGQSPEMELTELRVDNGQLQRARFRGMVKDVALGDLLALLAIEGVGGLARLQIGNAVATRAGVDELVLSGECRDVALAPLSAALGFGQISGVLRVEIDDLRVENNRLVALDARVAVDEADQGEIWIDRSILLEGARRVANMQLPALIERILPERVRCTRLGLGLQVRNEELQVLGMHGDDKDVILTIQVLGREFDVVRQTGEIYDLQPLLEPLRERLADALQRVP